MQLFCNQMKNFWQKIKKPIIALAPMAGVTDSAYRQICRACGADVVYTEMTSIDALYYDAKKTLAMLKFDKKEKPVVLQLFGKRPELVARAIKYVEAAGFSGIDINFGCPAKKVARHGGGIALLKDLDLCRALVKAVCDATKLPVSVKTRISINNNGQKVTVFDFLDKIKDLPVAALMLHGRSYEQGFVGEIDYGVMKKVRVSFSGIVLGNGGLNTPEDVKKMIDKTGVDGVGIARGVYGRPWIFKQIKDYLKTGRYKEPTLSQIKKIALQHAKYNFEMKGKHGIVEMRKHLCWYFRGFPDASKFRQGFVHVETLADIKKVLEEI